MSRLSRNEDKLSKAATGELKYFKQNSNIFDY